MNSASLVQALLRPDAYPWRPETVELIETHISWVFLAGEFVIKVKRPVVYPFLNHASLGRRRQSCLDEVRLNRRLTDGVYLSVVPIARTSTGCLVGGQGVPIEWGTLMRRLPASGMLETLLGADAVPCSFADCLATQLISFHRDRAPVCGQSTEAATAATRTVTDNLDELAPFKGAPLGSIQLGLVTDAMRRFIAERGDLLGARGESGWIREGHGDLRAEHICLEPDGVIQIFDCVEFNRELRCADVASDLAFLVMDLRRLGAPRMAASLLSRYRDAGMDLPDELLGFYQAHRALVRAKISCLGLAAATPTATRRLLVDATDYLDLASAAAVTVRPMLMIMTGLSGTGKSTAAQRLARALPAHLIASDVVRKALAGIDGAAPAKWGEGIYRPEWTKATYDQLFALADVHLRAGRPVILDATFLAAEQRAGAASVANRNGTRLVLIETVCDEGTVAKRLAARANHGTSRSDASFATYLRQRATAAELPPSVPSGALLVQIDTAGPLPVSLEGFFASLAGEHLICPAVPSGPDG